MRNALPALCLLLTFLPCVAEASWYLRDGTRIEGHLVGFDFDTKTVRFESEEGAATSGIAALDLSLRDRQRLLLSSSFLGSYPEEPSWPRKKRHLLLLAICAPAVVLLVSFWIAGFLLARKVHPARALIAFFGSWMVGVAFVCFYLFFAQRMGGGVKTVLFGTGVGLVFLSVFISAVYQCSLFRGLLIFLLQIFVGGFLAIVGLAASEAFAGDERASHFWNEHVFEPVGMIRYEWADRVKSSSSSAR